MGDVSLSEISNLTCPSAVFQWSTDKRLRDISVALVRAADTVPPDLRDHLLAAIAEVFEDALQVLLPGEGDELARTAKPPPDAACKETLRRKRMVP
jgi:hypothetical protein